MRVWTASPEETQALGEHLGRLLSRGDVVTLSGDLGAGKTALAQGIARGLDVRDVVSSPTFSLVHEYRGRVPVWHLDTYRLGSADELIDLSWADLLAGGGVILVEWPERIAEALPESRLEIELAHGQGDARELRLRPRGERMQRVVEQLERSLELSGGVGARESGGVGNPLS
ncbi:MAG: tRNA (adenosine(37)-N6)-threonylcarbamoyltransferase complex ATPase subunit type 1 TsaE [Armatimonadota bacterium]